MRAHAWRTPWRWGMGVVAAIMVLMLSGCGDSGSRGASGVTGSTSASESGAVSADKKGKGGGPIGARGNDDDEAGDDKGKGQGNNGQGNNGQGNNGQANGRPAGEVQGVVAGRTPGCPTFTFLVAGVGIRANGVTEFEGTSCATLQNGDLVKVEGQPLGNGTILAREVKALAVPPPGAPPVNQGAAPGVTVGLVNTAGDVAAMAVTNQEGKFELRNVPPGTYQLVAQLPGSLTPCAAPLASGIGLVAQRNRIRGQLGVAGAAACENLVLTRLESRNGNS
jgi:Domain of unknown function (DUF5666)/Carboxypeptidase regulatory-like domain